VLVSAMNMNSKFAVYEIVINVNKDGIPQKCFKVRGVYSSMEEAEDLSFKCERDSGHKHYIDTSDVAHNLIFNTQKK
jgi:hypothetical protein